jgi:hypothetical protein
MDTAKTLDSLLNGHTDQKCCDTLGVAGAAAGEGSLGDDTVLYVNIDLSGAYATGRVGDVLHDFLPLSL